MYLYQIQSSGVKENFKVFKVLWVVPGGIARCTPSSGDIFLDERMVNVVK